MCECHQGGCTLGWIENQKCCFFPLSQMNLGSTRKNKKVFEKENFSKMHRFLRISISSLQRNFKKLRGEKLNPLSPPSIFPRRAIFFIMQISVTFSKCMEYSNWQQPAEDLKTIVFLTSSGNKTDGSSSHSSERRR